MFKKREILKRIFSLLPYLEKNIYIDSKIALLYELYSLDISFGELIKNLYTSENRNIESFLAELNIIYDILENSPSLKNRIKYEQQSGNGKPDLMIDIDDVIIWAQIKCFSISEIDKKRKHSKLLLEKKLRERFNYYFDISLSYVLDLSDDEIEEIIHNMEEKKEYLYSHNNNRVKIKINNKNYNNVTASDFVPTTIYKTQIINNFRKAEKSLPKINKDSVNIIICQNVNGRQDNIDIGNVLFGEEKFIYESNYVHWERDTDGLIQNENINVNYYCTYETNSIIGCCEKWLFEIEPNHKIDITKILGIDLDHKISKDVYI